MATHSHSPLPRRSPRLARRRVSSPMRLDAERRLSFDANVSSVVVPSSVDVRPQDLRHLVSSPGSIDMLQIRSPNVSSESDPPSFHQSAAGGRSFSTTPEAENIPLSTNAEAILSGSFVIDEEEDRDGKVRASKADNISAAFSFLSDLNVRQLRTVLKDCLSKQSGNKNTLVARSFLHIQLQLLSGKTITEAMAMQRETVRFNSWLKHRIALDMRSPRYLMKAPPDTELFALLEMKEVSSYRTKHSDIERSRLRLDPVSAGQMNDAEAREEEARTETSNSAGVQEAASQQTHYFSINEFARLCIIMRDDEDAKYALDGTGQELSRPQLDAGFTRDSYWGVIETRFNDAGLRLNLNMTGNVDGVDSTLPPPCHRSATFLKDKFFDARKSFTEKATNWSCSGQNDNLDFKRFAGTPNGELTAEGKRMMVMFVCSRKGTEHEDTRFANLCSRVIAFGRGNDEGASEPLPERSVTRGRRRKNQKDIGDAFERSFQTYTTAKVFELRQKAEKRRKTERSNARMKDFEEKQFYVDSLARLEKTVKLSGLDHAPYKEAVEHCASLHMEELKRAFLMPETELEGLPCHMPESDDGPIASGTTREEGNGSPPIGNIGNKEGSSLREHIEDEIQPGRAD